MTKEHFISATPFYINKKAFTGDSTYYYDQGIISKQTRSSIDERVVLDTYECNVTKITDTCFKGFTYVMGKKVLVTYKFEDLVEFKVEQA